MSIKAQRRAEILDAALDLAGKNGYYNVRREQVALLVGCSTGLVSKYFGTMKKLHRAIVRRAIEVENLKVIAQATVLEDPQAAKAPRSLIHEALESFIV